MPQRGKPWIAYTASVSDDFSHQPEPVPKLITRSFQRRNYAERAAWKAIHEQVDEDEQGICSKAKVIAQSSNRLYRKTDRIISLRKDGQTQAIAYIEGVSLLFCRNSLSQQVCKNKHLHPTRFPLVGVQLKEIIMSIENRANAAAKDLKGKAQEAYGAATDNPDHKAAGQTKQGEAKTRNAVEDLKDKAKDMADNLGDQAQQVGDRTRDAIGDLKEKAQDTADNLGSKAKRTADSVSNKAKKAKQ